MVRFFGLDPAAYIYMFLWTRYWTFCFQIYRGNSLSEHQKRRSKFIV